MQRRHLPRFLLALKTNLVVRGSTVASQVADHDPPDAPL